MMNIKKVILFSISVVVLTNGDLARASDLISDWHERAQVRTLGVESDKLGLAYSMYELFKQAVNVNDYSFGSIRYNYERTSKSHSYSVTSPQDRIKIKVSQALNGKQAKVEITASSKTLSLSNEKNRVYLSGALAERLMSLFRSTQGVQREPILDRGKVIGEKQTAYTNYHGSGEVVCEQKSFIASTASVKISVKCVMNIDRI